MNPIFQKSKIKKKEKVIILLLGLFIATVVTFPLIFYPSSLFILREDLGKLRIGDHFVFIQYLSDAKEALLHLRPLYPILDKYPYFAMSTLYVYLGGLASVFTSPVIANNIFMFVCVVASFLAVYIYVRLNDGGVFEGFYGGLLFSSSNYMIHHIMDGHANLVAMFWIPLVFIFLEKTLTNSGWVYPVFFACTLVGTFLSCEHYFLYLSIFIPIYMVFAFGDCLRIPGLWVRMGGAFLLTFVFLIGLIISRVKIPPAQYSDTDNLMFSLHSFKELIGKNAEAGMSLTGISLAIIGAIHLCIIRNKKGIAIMIMAILSAILMFGPFHEFSPYSLLKKICQPLIYTRTPIRLVVFLLFFMSILAAKGLSFIFMHAKSIYVTLIISGAIILFIGIEKSKSMYWTRSPNGDKGVWTYYFSSDDLKTNFLKKKLIMEGKSDS